MINLPQFVFIGGITSIKKGKFSCLELEIYMIMFLFQIKLIFPQVMVCNDYWSHSPAAVSIVSSLLTINQF